MRCSAWHEMISYHCRCIVQLTLLGYILVPIFTYNQWWLVLLYASFMLYVGCLEASQRPAYSYTVCSISVGTKYPIRPAHLLCRVMRQLAHMQ